ncbi:MAG TPA: YjjG family noncanonical pyrimidine nucleotidase [Candidatus Bacteroides merdipullorum]|uniref:YjjG family noncanonical pyrimidine nucleotidase n=1 Tax=Candidatus Bacteroides merdipullorum TaxID=2838474 RepID=A0A9D2A5R4_9BACE|nr:YjjG family noncanonical pyrimidine nucleotidase [Candidatus Bacteroides merdipullorum]
MATTRYRNLFFDLDDTLWAFSENALDTFREMYDKYGYGRYFDSFDHFYSLYRQRNVQLWEEYGQGRVTKAELNRQRFLYPLLQVGVEDAALAARFAADFLGVIPTKRKLMPHACEALDYLAGRYRLYILSNGFRELQHRKMCAAGIDGYFRKIILSEDIGVLKPRKELFDFALSATQSDAGETLMIGDNWENDIAGARNAGWHQVYYAPPDDAASLPFRPTYRIHDLRELIDLL